MKRREPTALLTPPSSSATDSLSDADTGELHGAQDRDAHALHGGAAKLPDAHSSAAGGDADAASASPTAAPDAEIDAVVAASPNAAAVSGIASPASGPVVKKRRTKNFKWREDMAKSRGTLAVRIPPLEPPTFASWDAFIHAWTEYMAATKTLYRRRSSCTTTSWNSKNRFKKYPVPDSFQYATMAYWCTHGCIQPSRGTGVRAHLHNRFTGCTARITADVVYETNGDDDVRWFIRVRNQISQHNHKINDEIYTCYTNNSSVPDDLLLGPSDELDESSRMMRSFEPEDAEFENSSRMLAELEGHVDVDHVGKPASPDSSNTAAALKAQQRHQTNGSTLSGSTFSASSLLAREVLADDQKIHMARSELQPILNELKRTSSRVIHKRLQDVSEVVVHLLAKWHRDREAEVHQARSSLSNAAASGDESDQRDQQPSSGMYGADGGANSLLSHRLDTFSAELVVRDPPSALTTEAEAGAAASDDLGVVSRGTDSSSSAIAHGDDDVLSRHRGHSELV